MTKCISAISSEAQITCVVAAAPLMHRGEPAESTCWRAYTANETNIERTIFTTQH